MWMMEGIGQGIYKKCYLGVGITYGRVNRRKMREVLCFIVGRVYTLLK